MKHTGFIASVLFGAVTFYAGIQYSLNEMEKKFEIDCLKAHAKLNSSLLWWII